MEISIKEQKELFIRQRAESEKLNEELKKEKSDLIDKLEKQKEINEVAAEDLESIVIEADDKEGNNVLALKKKISMLELQLQQTFKELLHFRNQAMNSILQKDVNEAVGKMEEEKEEVIKIYFFPSC